MGNRNTHTDKHRRYIYYINPYYYISYGSFFRALLCAFMRAVFRSMPLLCAHERSGRIIKGLVSKQRNYRAVPRGVAGEEASNHPHPRGRYATVRLGGDANLAGN